MASPQNSYSHLPNTKQKTEELCNKYFSCKWIRLHLKIGRLTYTHTKQGLPLYRVIQNDCRGFNNLSYTIHLALQMQHHVISFYGVTSSIPKLKVVTCYKQFGTNSIIVLMFVESQRVHKWSTYKVCNKNLDCCSIK